jgi:hypothetical protein
MILGIVSLMVGFLVMGFNYHSLSFPNRWVVIPLFMSVSFLTLSLLGTALIINGLK